MLIRGYVLHSEHVGSDLFRWSPAVTNELLHASYLQWCEANRINRTPEDRRRAGQASRAILAAEIQNADGYIIGEARFDATGPRGRSDT